MPEKEDLVSQEHEWEQMINKLRVTQMLHAPFFLTFVEKVRIALQILAEIPAGDVTVITQGMMIDDGTKKETTLTRKHYIVTINPLLNTTEQPEIPGGGYYSDTTGDKNIA